MDLELQREGMLPEIPFKEGKKGIHDKSEAEELNILLYSFLPSHSPFILILFNIVNSDYQINQGSVLCFSFSFS